MYAPRLDRFGDDLPRDAIARYGTTRFRHGCAGVGVGWSPDGALLATWHLGGVHLWDPRSGALVRALDVRARSGVAALVSAVLFLRDGTAVVASSGGASWWNVGTGTLLRAFERVTGDVAVSPDGRMLVGLEDSYVAQRYDLRDGRALGALTGSPLEVWTRLAFTPDGRWIVTASYHTGAILRFDAQTGVLDRGLVSGNAGWREVAFSRDGRTLAATTNTGGARRFDASSWEERPALCPDDAIAGHTSIASAGDGSWVLCGGGSLARAHPDEPALRWRVTGVPWNASAALSPDDRTVAVGGEASIWRYDAATGERARDDGHARFIKGARRRRDGSLVTFGASAPAEVLRWRDDASAPERIDVACAGAPVDLSHDGARIALVDGDGALRIASLEGDGRVVDVGAAETVTDARFLTDGRLLVTREGTVTLASPADGRETVVWAQRAEAPAAVSHDGALVLTNGARARVRRLDDGAEVCAFKHPGGFSEAAFTRDGATVVTLGTDGLRAWDALTGAPRAKVYRVLPTAATGRRVTCFALSHDGLLAFAGDSAGDLYGVDFGARRVTPLGPAHRGEVLSLDLDHASYALRSTGCDATALAWDVAALRARCTPKKRARG